MSNKRLGIGFIGSGFITKFHIQSFVGVRDADVRGIWSPNKKHAEETAAFARKLDVGETKAYRSITEMASDPAIEAIWICGPNHARVANVAEICDAVRSGKATLKGVACEKPLARNVGEAKKITAMVKKAGLNHGYLEDQIFAPPVNRARDIVWARGAKLAGRPYLARSAEEHSGPHMPWFWQGELQGGGVLNDMMCHSVEVARYMLTEPGKPRRSIRPLRVTAHTSCLKWSRPEYAKKLSKMMGKAVDYLKKPAEDYAAATVEYEDEKGNRLISELTTSWSFVGAGLRLSLELLGPEYSCSMNSLESGLKVFFSRAVQGPSGEDLVEKQNAETGVMPLVSNEASEYGYESENRHMSRAFLSGEPPRLTFDDGVEVMELLMTAYMSAEQGKTIEFPPRGLDTFIPAVAKGKWKPK